MSNNRERRMSMREQLRVGMFELRSIVEQKQSPSADGRLTVRTVSVRQPSHHTAKSIRIIRRSMSLSQAVFAQLLGVSPALVRAWELGTRTPAPMARRLLDSMRENPFPFCLLIKTTDARKRARVA